MNPNKEVHNFGGVPDTIIVEDVLYQYAHVGDQLNLLQSSDGINWENYGSVLSNAKAPSVVKLDDGTYRMYFVRQVLSSEYNPK